MHRAVPVGLILASLLLATPQLAAADGPTNGNVIVPGDHLMPGEQFRITGFNMDPGVALSLRLVSPARSDDLGGTTVAPDGTIDATGVVPSGFPFGYAELQAVSSADGAWSTTVLIGPRAEGPGGTNAAPDDGGRGIALLVLGIGLLIVMFAGASYVRGRSPRSPTRP